VSRIGLIKQGVAIGCGVAVLGSLTRLITVLVIPA